MSSLEETLAVVTALVFSIVGTGVALALVIGVSMSSAKPGISDPGGSCAEWTDGCVVCQRTAQGPACSTPGIACTPGPERCLRRS